MRVKLLKQSWQHVVHVQQCQPLLTLWTLGLKSPDPNRWEVASGSFIAFIALSRKHLFTSLPPPRLSRNHTFFLIISASTQCDAWHTADTVCLKGWPSLTRGAWYLRAAAYEEQWQCSKAKLQVEFCKETQFTLLVYDQVLGFLICLNSSALKSFK